MEIGASQLYVNEVVNSELTLIPHEDDAQYRKIDEGVLTGPQNHEEIHLLCPRSETLTQTPIDVCGEYEVEQILMSHIYYRKLQYCLK